MAPSSRHATEHTHRFTGYFDTDSVTRQNQDAKVHQTACARTLCSSISVTISWSVTPFLRSASAVNRW